MAQDDVTDPKPLRGGRQRANHIQIHRIELSLPERKMMESYLWDNRVSSLTTGAGAVVTSAGIGLAAFGLYWFFDAGWEITKNIKDSVESYWDDYLTEGNPLALTPLEMQSDEWYREQGFTPISEGGKPYWEQRLRKRLSGLKSWLGL